MHEKASTSVQSDVNDGWVPEFDNRLKEIYDTVLINLLNMLLVKFHLILIVDRTMFCKYIPRSCYANAFQAQKILLKFLTSYSFYGKLEAGQVDDFDPGGGRFTPLEFNKEIYLIDLSFVLIFINFVTHKQILNLSAKI